MAWVRASIQVGNSLKSLFSMSGMGFLSLHLGDANQCQRVQARLEARTVWVNQYGLLYNQVRSRSSRPLFPLWERAPRLSLTHVLMIYTSPPRVPGAIRRVGFTSLYPLGSAIDGIRFTA